MLSLSELGKSVREAFYERGTSPLYGSLIISWIMWNWKVLYILLFYEEQMTVAMRFEKVLEVSHWSSLYVWPPLTAAFLVFLMPFASNFVYKFSETYKIKRKEIKFKIQKLTPINFEEQAKLLDDLSSKDTEVAKLKIDVAKMREEHESTSGKFAEKEVEVSSLKSQLEEEGLKLSKLENKHKKLESEHSGLKKEFSVSKKLTLPQKVIFKDNNFGGWHLNHWGSHNESKTNRIENNELIFEAVDNELKHKSKQFGANIDLKRGISNGKNYLIECTVRSEAKCTMKFQLWVHDTMQNPKSTVTMPPNAITPSTENESISLIFPANETNALRIHLHCTAGTGKIIVSDVTVTEAE